MDGATSPFEGESALSSGLPDYAKKAMPAERIAELALIDPKRAKRWGESFYTHQSIFDTSQIRVVFSYPYSRNLVCYICYGI
jgi:hypothetical protein